MPCEIKLVFTIPGKPRGKGRARTRVMGKHAGMYADPKTVEYENLVRIAFATEYPDWVPADSSTPIGLRFNAYFPIPKSTPKYKRKEMEKEKTPYLGKPDIDNIQKSIMDGLNGIAFTDDRQVFKLIDSGKYYSAKPRVEVFLLIDLKET